MSNLVFGLFWEKYGLLKGLCTTYILIFLSFKKNLKGFSDVDIDLTFTLHILLIVLLFGIIHLAQHENSFSTWTS